MLLENLVDNAIRYTPAGGTIDVAVTAGGGTAVLSVADDGPGTPTEDRERVFDRFYRRGSSVATGSGLGMSIVRRIAQRHGAAVELGEGAHGRGLVVTVRFADGGQVRRPGPATAVVHD